MSGDVTIDNAGAATIGANKVTTAKILDGNVTNAKLDKSNIPLSGFGAAAADVALGGKKLTGVANPTLDQDAATKNYVDVSARINAISTINANYTAQTSDQTILCNNTSGAFTLTLPTASSSTGQVFIIRKIDETNNVLTFSPSLKLTETTTIASINFSKTIRIQSNGSSWYIID